MKVIEHVVHSLPLLARVEMRVEPSYVPRHEVVPRQNSHNRRPLQNVRRMCQLSLQEWVYHCFFLAYVAS